MCSIPPVLPSVEIRYFAVTVAIITGVVGTLYNGISIVALVFNKKLLKKPFTFLLINLAVADFLYCVLALPIHVLYNIKLGDDSWFIRNFNFCRISALVRYLNAGIDWWTITLIAIERYVAICKVFKHRQIFTVKKTLGMLALMWCLTIFIMLLTYFGLFGEFVYTRDVEPCDYNFEGVSLVAEHLFRAYFGYLSFLFIILSYGAIYRKLRKYRKWRQSAAIQTPVWIS